MRRLLIKLVAVETALVGWLSYWLFILYANNPSVTQALADKLSRFPQFSFTTIDISVLVVIGVLSILLALKFQRGLKPGIRLERALQMLETLMKRNLFLESQVAELKLEKGHIVPPPPSAPPATVGSQPGSWERAFRTPIEAGPGPVPTPARPSTPVQGSSILDRAMFSLPATMAKAEMRPMAQPATPPKVPSMIPENQETKPVEARVGLGSEKTVSFGPAVRSSSWEDSPQHVLETFGILNPPLEARKQASIIPGSTLNTPASIPPPPTKVSPPPGVIVGPGVSSFSQRKPSLRASPLLPLSKPGPAGLLGPSLQGPKPTSSPPPAPQVQSKPVTGEPKPPADSPRFSESSEAEAESGKPPGRPRPQLKKRFAFEEE